MLDSLVRVSRRVVQGHFTNIKKDKGTILKPKGIEILTAFADENLLPLAGSRRYPRGEPPYPLLPRPSPMSKIAPIRTRRASPSSHLEPPLIHQQERRCWHVDGGVNSRPTQSEPLAAVKTHGRFDRPDTKAEPPPPVTVHVRFPFNDFKCF